MPHTVGWYVGLAVTLLVELFVIWRIVRILNRGTVKVDLLFWTTWYAGLDVTANRATNPILYWIGVALAVLLAIVVAAIFVLIVVNN